MPAPESNPRPLDANAVHRRVQLLGRRCRRAQAAFGGAVYLAQKLDVPRARGYSGVREYAARLGGLSRAKVDQLMRIGRALEGLPRLYQLFLDGRVPWTKLKAVIAHVTPETDADWARRVETLSRRALEELCRGLRRQNRPDAPPFPGPPPGLSRLTAIASGAAAPPPASSEPDASQDTKSAPDQDFGPEKPSPGKETVAPMSAPPPRPPGPAGASGRPEAPGPAGATPPGPEAGPGGASPASAKGQVPPLRAIDPLVAQLFVERKAWLSRQLGRSLSDMEALKIILEAFPGLPGKPIEYVEVIVREERTGARFMRTCWGPQPVDDADIAGWSRKGDAIDLEVTIAAVGRAQAAARRRQVSAARAAGRPPPRPSRHVPAAVERIVHYRDGGICRFPGCGRLAELLHHVDRWALNPVHDPARIFEVCERHHDLIHAGYVAGEDGPPDGWRVRLDPVIQSRDEARRSAVDRRVQECRATATGSR